MAKTLKMDLKVKRKWLHALRSGKYKKTKYALHNKKGFCCLGVLTDLYMKEHGVKDGWSEVRPGEDRRYKLSNEDLPDFSSVLPTKVSRWAGLGAEQNPEVDGHALACWNDGGDGVKPKGFKKIADLISKNL